MKTLDKFISPLIVNQFPEIYKSDGPLFILFVKAYFEWLEASGNILNESRSIPEYRDIDTTLTEFVSLFKNKYMHGIPLDVPGDIKFLQKHIKEVYGSKGTKSGLELLFRLLFNEEATVYIPGDDILKPSDGTWNVPTYIEVQNNQYTALLVGEEVTGRLSGATAFVESYKTQYIDGNKVDILILSTVIGTFRAGEELLSNVLSVANSPRVRGSLSDLEINNGGLNFIVGDVLDIVSSERGKRGKAVVTQTGVRDGAIVFDVQNGGTGYTNSFFEDLAGLPAEHRTTISISGDGVGANFQIGKLIDLETRNLLIDQIDPSLAFALDSTYTWAANPLSNIDTPLNNALTAVDLTFGTIADENDGGLYRLSVGSGYTTSPTISVTNDLISGLTISDGLGGFAGNNAVVSGNAVFGSGLIERVRVIDSGLAYRNGESVSLESVRNPVISSGTVIAQTQGKAMGSFKDTRGFLNSDKYIHDNFFYQEYSYEVRSALPFERYSDILRQLWHPAGLEKFGRVLHSDTIADSSDVVDFELDEVFV